MIKYDVVRGSTFTLYAAGRDGSNVLVNLTGYVVTATGRWPGGNISVTLVIDAGDNTRSLFTLTPAQTRLLPKGLPVVFEVQFTAPSGAQTVVDWVELTGKGGSNAD